MRSSKAWAWRRKEAAATATGIVIVGVGGQGTLLATQVAAMAAMNAGFDVKTNEVHGMAQRGGSVVAQVRYGEKVWSPLVPDGTAKVLASLERIEALRYANLLAPDGVAVVSSQAIIPVTVSSGKSVYPQDAEQRVRRIFPRLIWLDAVEIAEGLHDVRTVNVVVLGAVSTALDIGEDCWLRAIEACVKPAYVKVNLEAFRRGREEAATHTTG
jgi:indolepyruvate ferredoxin oxidoreductase beta subunit